MNERKVKLVFFNFDASSDIVNEFKNLLASDTAGSNTDESVVACNDYIQASNILRKLSGGIFIFMVETRNDFIQSMTVLKANQKLFSKGLFRVLCLTDVKSRKVLSLLNKYNCNDILPVTTTFKTLNVKVGIWKKSIELSLSSLINDDLELGKREADYQEISNKKTVYQFESNKVLDETSSNYSFNDDDFDEDELLDDIFSSDEFSDIDFSDAGEVSLNLAPNEPTQNTKEIVNLAENKIDISLESGSLEVELVSRDDSNNIDLDVECRFESFFEDEIVVEIPRENLIKDSTVVEVSVKFIYNRCRVELILDGVVSESECTDDAGNIVTVKLNNKENDKLDHFMALFQERQKSVAEFLALAKGH